MKVNYQVVIPFDELIDIKQALKELFIQAIDMESSSMSQKPDESMYEQCITIKYQKPFSEKKLIGFSVDYSFDSNDALSWDSEPMTWKGEALTYTSDNSTYQLDKQIASNFCDLLKGNKSWTVFKYSDNFLLKALERNYREIFELEMKLREAITIIFVHKYQNDLFDLLIDFEANQFSNLKALKSKKIDWSEKEADKSIDWSQRLNRATENEFFHLLFSDYRKLDNPSQQISVQTVVKLIVASRDFEVLATNLNSRGITNKDHLSFLSKIKPHLENIEDLRNCVAHNKTPSDREIENYDSSKNTLNKLLDEFLKEIQETSTK